MALKTAMRRSRPKPVIMFRIVMAISESAEPAAFLKSKVITIMIMGMLNTVRTPTVASGPLASVAVLKIEAAALKYHGWLIRPVMIEPKLKGITKL